MTQTFVTKLEQTCHTIDLHAWHYRLADELPYNLDSLEGLIVGADKANDFESWCDKHLLLGFVIGQREKDFLDYDVEDVFL